MEVLASRADAVDLCQGGLDPQLPGNCIVLYRDTRFFARSVVNNPGILIGGDLVGISALVIAGWVCILRYRWSSVSNRHQASGVPVTCTRVH